MRVGRDQFNPFYDLIEAVGDIQAPNPASEPAPQDTASSKFKTIVYKYVRDWITTNRSSRIKSFCYDLKDGRKTIEFEDNQFNWVLHALYKEGEGKKFLSPSKINSLGWQLLHAYRHEIDPNLLIGFLYQTSASSSWKQKKIKNKGAVFYEPWFKRKPSP